MQYQLLRRGLSVSSTCEPHVGHVEHVEARMFMRVLASVGPSVYVAGSGRFHLALQLVKLIETLHMGKIEESSADPVALRRANLPWLISCIQ